jgi:hypothetical protein
MLAGFFSLGVNSFPSRSVIIVQFAEMHKCRANATGASLASSRLHSLVVFCEKLTVEDYDLIMLSSV